MQDIDTIKSQLSSTIPGSKEEKKLLKKLRELERKQSTTKKDGGDMKEKKFDVFISYNSKDKEAVWKIAEWLKEEHNLEVWLDNWELQPGKEWQPGLKKGVVESKAVAVFIGNNGIGVWQNQEVQVALNISAQTKIPVIPVLLPSSSDKPALPDFLELRTWVDFRDVGLDDEEARNKLLWGITGEKISNLGNKIDNVKPRLEKASDEISHISSWRKKSLQRRLKGLREEWELRNELYIRLKKAYSLTEDYEVKKQKRLEIQIKEQEDALEKLEKELFEIEEKLS